MIFHFHFREDGFQIRSRQLFLAEVTARFLKLQKLGYLEVSRYGQSLNGELLPIILLVEPLTSWFPQ